MPKAGRRAHTAVLALTLALTACSGLSADPGVAAKGLTAPSGAHAADEGTVRGVGSAPAAGRVQLTSDATRPLRLPQDAEVAGFASCHAFLTHMQSRALERVTPWGLDDGHGGWWHHGDLMLEQAVPDAAFGGPADADLVAAPVSPPGVEHSGTNLQEAGVDEPDQVKTDGRTLYAVADGALQVLDITGDVPQPLAQLPLAQLPLAAAHDVQLLLHGDRLLLSSSGPVIAPFAGQQVAEATQEDRRSDELPVGSAPPDWPAPWQPGPATLTLIDVHDPAAPVVLEQLVVDGAIRSARMVDGVARIVVRSPQVTLPWVTPQGSGLRAERAALRQNEALILGSQPEDWLPWSVHTTADGDEWEGPLLGCTRVAAPQDVAGFQLLSVLTIGLDTGSDGLQPGDGTLGLLAEGETVYASRDTLYVASTRWPEHPGRGPWDRPGAGDPVDPWDRPDPSLPAPSVTTTQLHAFDITDQHDVHYLGSGSVDGTLLSQWALSEHDGVLRVASTVGELWGPEPSESLVTVLGLRDGALVELGRVDGLGVAERIYAVRFLGDRGYVVTFRQVDPLYTIDLSDPTDPRETGELKILGYSAYLHPIGDDLLIGVGQDADEDGWLRGTQLSLFDISDDREPLRIDQVTLGPGSSDVEHDHRAFLHWPTTGLTVVPYVRTDRVPGGWDDEVAAGAVGFTADRAAGLRRVGELSHDRLLGAAGDDPAAGDGPGTGTGTGTGTSTAAPSVAPPLDPWWDPTHTLRIRRTLVVGDRLLSISELGVMVHDLDTLDDRGWHRFGV